MYQALYRKYRPQIFDDVIGQSHITESLKNQVVTGRLSHAYIFVGTRGTGKTTCSRILAKAVNCENPVGGNPCCRCPSCLSIASGEALDIVEIDAASNNGVNDVRLLRDEAVFSPSVLKKRVYIIDEVHMLSTPAFNALLKILEEPPEHLLFILATTELQKVPATILSRCQRHSFHRVKNSDVAKQLLKISARENLNLTPDAAMLLAGLGEGSVRDSVTMLDQCSSYGEIGVEQVYSTVGLAGTVRTVSLFKKIAAGDAEGAISDFTSMWEDGKEPASVLKELSGLSRDVLMLSVAPKSAGELIYGGYSLKALQELAAALTVEELVNIADTLQSALASMKDRLNARMTAEISIISLCNNRLADTPKSLAARIARLERIASGSGFIRPAADATPADEEDDGPDFTEDAEPELPWGAGPGWTEDPVACSAASEPPTEYEYPPEPPAEPQAYRPEAMPVPSATEKPEPPENRAPRAGPSPEAEVNVADVMKKIAEAVGNNLRMDLKITLKCPEKYRAYLDGEFLTLEFEPGFMYNSFVRSDVMETIEKAACRVLGGSVRLRIHEIKPDDGPRRPLSDLRQFPEVKFI